MGMVEGGRRLRPGSLILWTENDRVFAIQGDLMRQDLMQMAESVS